MFYVFLITRQQNSILYVGYTTLTLIFCTKAYIKNILKQTKQFFEHHIHMNSRLSVL